MSWTKKPIVRFLFLLVLVSAIGGGWRYFFKRAECEKAIEFCPATTFMGSPVGEYHSYRCGLTDINSKYETRKEGISACMWR